MKEISISIEPATTKDTKSIIEMHRSAVFGLAKDYYSEEILREWAMPLTDERIKKTEDIIKNPDIICKVAKFNDKVVGTATLSLKENYLKQCYVHADYAGKGIGKMLLHNIEEEAKKQGIKELLTTSSLNAEKFYQSQGFITQEYGEHVLPSGTKMASVKMHKEL